MVVAAAEVAQVAAAAAVVAVAEECKARTRCLQKHYGSVVEVAFPPEKARLTVHWQGHSCVARMTFVGMGQIATPGHPRKLAKLVIPGRALLATLMMFEAARCLGVAVDGHQQ